MFNPKRARAKTAIPTTIQLNLCRVALNIALDSDQMHNPPTGQAIINSHRRSCFMAAITVSMIVIAVEAGNTNELRSYRGGNFSFSVEIANAEAASASLIRSTNRRSFRLSALLPIVCSNLDWNERRQLTSRATSGQTEGDRSNQIRQVVEHLSGRDLRSQPKHLGPISSALLHLQSSLEVPTCHV